LFEGHRGQIGLRLFASLCCCVVVAAMLTAQTDVCPPLICMTAYFAGTLNSVHLEDLL